MITYYIAYSCIENRMPVFGNTEVSVDKPIKNIEHVLEIAKAIGNKSGLEQVVILNWRRFE